MPPAPTTSTCTTCGGNSGSCSSCGTAVTTCKLLELIKCMKGFKSCTDKKQIFPIVQATTNFDITVGNLPADMADIDVTWNGVGLSPLVDFNGRNWIKTGNTIIISPAVGGPDANGNIEKCIIQVTFKECKTIQDEIKEKCPELYTLIR